MRIVLATPLYPPDTAPQARYVKELAERLRKEHEVTIVAYAHIPEAVSGVRIVAVDKTKPIPIRLALYTLALWHALRSADLVYAVNGPSVELPLFLLSFMRTPLVFGVVDSSARERMEENFFARLVHRAVRSHARAVVTAMPPERPEILPFAPPPDTTAYEQAWKAHLSSTFAYGT